MTIAHDEVLSRGHHAKDVPLEYTTEESVLKIFGFWIFLAADLILFSCLFATFIVIRGNVAAGPTGRQLFEVPIFMAETIILLTSSFTCGLATYSMRRKQKGALIAWLVITVLLGMSFIYLEVSEFMKYATSGSTMATSGFLSGFFTLVGTHGCHVSMGILWMLSIIFQIARHGVNVTTARKVFIVGLYWHFLDVVWVFLFTVVYLMGVMPQ